MRINKINIIALLIFVLAIFFLKFDTIRDPYVWDDMVEAAVPALDMYDNNFRIIHPKYNFGHPPLQQFLLALTWRVFGHSLVAAHIFIFIFGAIGLWATFLLAQHFFGSRAGFGAAVLLLFHPLFFTHLGLQTDAIPLLTFGVLTVLAYVKKKPLLTAVFGTLLVLTKETGFMVIGALYAYSIYKQVQGRNSTSILWDPTRKKFNKVFQAVISTLKENLPLHVATLFLLWWFVFTWATQGWALRTDLILNAGQFFTILIQDFVRYFVIDFNHPTTLVFGISTGLILYYAFWNKKFRQASLLLVFVILVHMFLFAFTHTAPRYYVAIIAFYCVLVAWGIHMACKNINLFYLAIGFVGVVYLPLLYNHNEPAMYSMGYRSGIPVVQEAVEYLETVYPDRRIITEWPFTDILFEPRLGYVQQPFQILDAGTHRRNFFVEGTNNFNKDYLLGLDQSVLVAYYHTGNPIFRAMEKSSNMQLVKSITYDNRHIVIFEINSTSEIRN
jgi:hypothetical protein